jgi:hypothetical protein
VSQLGAIVLRILPIAILFGCVESEWTVCRDGRVCGPGTVCDVVNQTCSAPAEGCLEEPDGRTCADGARVCRGGHCVSSCADGVLNGPDDCDGADFGGRTCVDYGTYGGELTCTETCEIDPSGCSGRCGDGQVDVEHEFCDPVDFDTAGAVTCVSLGLDAGRQGCADDCAGPTSRTCMTFGWSLEIAVPADGETGSVGDLWGTDDSLLAMTAAGVARSTDGQTWDLVGGTAGLVEGNALWASSARDIWVISGNADGFYRWDGSRWSQAAAPVTGLIEIWGSSASDVFAVGRSGVVHFDGQGWSVQPVPGSGRLQAIWGVGPDAVYAAGEGGTLLRYDGERWTAMDSGTSETLTGVWASSESDVWTISATRVRRHDGRGWRVMFTFADEDPNGRAWISGSGPNDLWVCGGATGEVQRYDGVSWSRLLDGQEDGAQPLWVDGRAAALGSTDPAALAAVRRWFGAGSGPLLAEDGDWLDGWADERAWVAVGSERATARGIALASDGPLEFFDQSLNHVAGASDGRVYAADSAGTIHVRQDGAWSVAHAEPNAKIVELWTGGADVYAMTIEEKEAPSRIIHFDGERWADLPPIGDGCGQVGASGWASAPDDVWVAGTDLLAHYDGSAWTCHDGAEPGQPFLSLWGSSAVDVWAFQAEGAPGPARLHHWNGAAWTSQVTTGVGRLVGTRADDVFLGSDQHFDGRVWTPIRSTGIRGAVTAASPGRLLTINVVFERGGLGQFVRTRFWNQRAREAGCSDGVDDDSDGLTDGDDADCGAGR